jgi:hypothetical protein
MAERAGMQYPAETLESPSLREACLSVRLWSAATQSGQQPSLWESDHPAACLTLDLIAASGGLPMTHQGEVLVASFPDFQSAAMTARRLQWAVQGFKESEEPRATCLSLLIHSADESAAESVAEDAFHSLNLADSGAILLTEKASQPFDRLPGFPLQVAAGDGLWELAWSRPDEHFSRSEDEEFLASFAAQNGFEESVPEPPAPQAVGDSAAEEYRTGSHRTGSHRTGSYRQPSTEEPQKSSKLWIAGVALAFVAAVAFYLYLGKSNSAPTASQIATQNQPQTEANSTPESSTTAVSENSSAPAQSKHTGVQGSASTAKPSKNAPKPEVQQAKETPPEKPRQVEPPAPKPSRENNGRCDLDPSQYGGLISQAEKNLGRGKYSDAIRQFAAVLACDPGNGRARDGMERAKLASAE